MELKISPYAGQEQPRSPELRQREVRAKQEAARKAAKSAQMQFSGMSSMNGHRHGKDGGGLAQIAKLPTDLQVDSMAAHVAEVLKRAKGYHIEDKDSDALFTRNDRISYWIENYVASHSNAMLKILCVGTGAIIVVFGTIWGAIDNLGWSDYVKDADGNYHYEANGRPWSYGLAAHWFNAFQMLATGGWDSTLGNNMSSKSYKSLYQIFFVVLLMFGLVVFAVLVGIITTTFESMMSSIEEGQTKVAERNHTLILGWNESTLRVVCQIALLRRVWRMQNKRWDRYLFPWLRVPPSTPVAKYPVVIMCNTKSKADMDMELGNALAQRGISPKRTRIGWDVVCRIGDPTSVHDLVRVSANSAQSILLMMTNEDKEELESTDGKVVNGATINTLLALRTVICGSRVDLGVEDADPTNDMRIVVQLAQASMHVTAACFRSSEGKKLCEALDLTVFVNTLLFKCASVRNLSDVVTSIMDFEGAAIRCRKVSEIYGGPHNEAGWLIGKTFRQGVLECTWEKSILVGVTSERVLYEWGDGHENGGRKSHDAMAHAGSLDDFGIVPDSDYIYNADDYAIFVSPTSMPTVPHKRVMVNTQKQTDAIKDIDQNALSYKYLTDGMKVHQKLIVCGWRMQWTANHARFMQRILEVGKHAKQDSYISFMNQMSTDDFAENLKLANGEPFATEISAGDPRPKGIPEGTRAWAMKDCPNLTLYHFRGDASSIDDLRPVLKTQGTYLSALVLGTQANNITLAPVSMDRRLLSILLLFKHLTIEWPVKPHVISENQIDQTADIAVTPAGAEFEPDFVNTRKFSV